jgi:MoaA/NifB/PqqE/SkfB family radical SAM enzyme
MSIHILLNQSCNLSCDYCFAKILLNKKQMSFENFKVILEFLKNNMDSMLHLIGGEPTLHPKFREFVSYALNNYPHLTKISIITNGSFQSSLFDGLNLSKFLFSVNVTDRIRTPALLKNLLFIKKNTNELHICINIRDISFDFDSYLSFLKEIRPHKVYLNITLPQEDNKNVFLITSDPNFKRKFVLFTKDILSMGISIGQDCFTPCCYFDSEPALLHKTRIGKCKGSYFVDSDLDFFICPFFDIPLIKITEHTSWDFLTKVHDSLLKDQTNACFDSCSGCYLKKRNICNPCAAYFGKENRRRYLENFKIMSTFLLLK